MLDFHSGKLVHRAGVSFREAGVSSTTPSNVHNVKYQLACCSCFYQTLSLPVSDICSQYTCVQVLPAKRGSIPGRVLHLPTFPSKP